MHSIRSRDKCVYLYRYIAMYAEMCVYIYVCLSIYLCIYIYMCHDPRKVGEYLDLKQHTCNFTSNIVIDFAFKIVADFTDIKKAGPFPMCWKEIHVQYTYNMYTV